MNKNRATIVRRLSISLHAGAASRVIVSSIVTILVGCCFVTAHAQTKAGPEFWKEYKELEPPAAALRKFFRSPKKYKGTHIHWIVMALGKPKGRIVQGATDIVMESEVWPDVILSPASPLPGWDKLDFLDLLLVKGEFTGIRNGKAVIKVTHVLNGGAAKIDFVQPFPDY